MRTIRAVQPGLPEDREWAGLGLLPTQLHQHDHIHCLLVQAGRAQEIHPDLGKHREEGQECRADAQTQRPSAQQLATDQSYQPV